jgi:hypothetical protein
VSFARLTNSFPRPTRTPPMLQTCSSSSCAPTCGWKKSTTATTARWPPPPRESIVCSPTHRFLSLICLLCLPADAAYPRTPLNDTRIICIICIIYIMCYYCYYVSQSHRGAERHAARRQRPPAGQVSTDHPLTHSLTHKDTPCPTLLLPSYA